MAKKIVKAQMMQRRDIALQWSIKNPVLLDGELGIVTDQPGSYKVGDGVTAWNDLPLRGFDGNIVHTPGESATAVMSQKGVTEVIDLLGKRIAESTAELAQLSQELKALKARVAALEQGGGGGNEEPEEPIKYYTISASAENGYVIATSKGKTIELPYVAEVGESIVLEVIANEDYAFTAWSDGNTDNPRTIVVNEDMLLYAICGDTITIPDEYALLSSISSNGGGAYLSTGEPIDMNSNYDLYFAADAIIGSNTALFGIRRATGSNDTMANGFYFNERTSWSPYAWVCGGTDTSNILASGCGVQFYGNLHKLSQRKKDLFEWDRQIYHIEKDFTNIDGVPAFIGALAKTASTTYNTNTVKIVFYRFVAMNDNGVIYKDMRPVKRLADGKLGGYDVVSQEFMEAVGSWSEGKTSAADAAKITIGTQVLNALPSPSGTLQSANHYKGYWISVHDTQKTFAIAKGDITNNGTIQYPTQQVLTCSEYDSAWHGNTSWLSDKKWDESDFFPLLYVSTDKANELLLVYRIKGTNPDALEGIEIVQRIHTPYKWHFNNYYGMAGVNTIIHTGYTQNSWQSSDNENTIMARVLPLPDPKSGNVILYEFDALTADFDLGFNIATGDGYWTGKYLAITYSMPSNGEGTLKFYEIDEQNAAVVHSVSDLHNYQSKNFLGNIEIEGIKYCPFNGKWTFCFEPSTGRTNLIDYKGWKTYTEIKQW